MSENLDFLLQILRVDIFIAFGIYSILYVITSLFIKSSILKIIDENACKIMIYAGLIFLLTWICLIASAYSQSTEEDQLGMIDRMFGNYWFGYWLQPIIWVLFTQLLRIEKIKKDKLLRIILSFFFIISIEQFVLITVSFHSDYLPSSWSLQLTPLEIIIGIVSKTLLFLAIVGIYYFINQKIGMQISRKTNK